MKATVLLIDDDVSIAEHFEGKVDSEVVDLRIAESHAEAIAQQVDDVDLILCDLKMPADAETGVEEVVHGLAAADHFAEAAPGVPVVIFSAFGQQEDLDDRLARAPSAPVFGRSDVPLLRHIKKVRIDEAVDLVRTWGEDVRRLHNEIELGWGDSPSVDLSKQQKQVLRIYARLRKACLLRLRSLAGGRSGAVTLWVEAQDEEGSIVSRVIAKLDGLHDVLGEERVFRDHVEHLLPPDSYAGSLKVIRAGAGGSGGLFYSPAAGYDSTLFELTRTDPSVAASTVAEIQTNLEPWHATPHQKQITVGDVRKTLVSDGTIAELRGRFSWLPDEDFEATPVAVNWSRTHGDLHGANVLVKQDGGSMLIDFGRVGMAPAILDPITLELAMVLHPDADLDLGDWPSTDLARAWTSSDYVDQSPIRPVVEACRTWMGGVMRGDRERDALVYAYAGRQLQYSDADPIVLEALMSGAVERIRAT